MSWQTIAAVVQKLCAEAERYILGKSVLALAQSA